MMLSKRGSIIWSILLINFCLGFSHVAKGKAAQTESHLNESAAIKQKVEKLAPKNKVRIQLKSNEKLEGRIIERNSTSVAIQVVNADTAQRREIPYQDIKSIQPEEKLTIGIKVLSVVVAVVIIGVFVLVNRHDS